MEAWDGDQEVVVEFLRVVSDADRVPVLVHYSYGADRTGAMCAVYRIAVRGWTKEEAIREMTQGGFGFHPVWTNLAIQIWRLDIDETKAQAGIG
jgi:DSP-PTPase phosphatase fused to NAD+ Kinase